MPDRGQNSKLASLNLGQGAEISSVDSSVSGVFISVWSERVKTSTSNKLLTTYYTVVKHGFGAFLSHDSSDHLETCATGWNTLSYS